MNEHILVVDDEFQTRELVSDYLQKQGYRVSNAANSQETLRLVRDESVNLVVLDIALANEDGLELLAKLKAQSPNLRVVMLTGMGFVEDLMEEAQKKGADGYVSKTLPLSELSSAIDHALDSASREAVMELYLEPSSASEESVQRLMLALSRLHIAAGGTGLEFHADDGFVHVGEGVVA